jgi:hypothetical protein
MRRSTGGVRFGGDEAPSARPFSDITNIYQNTSANMETDDLKKSIHHV